MCLLQLHISLLQLKHINLLSMQLLQPVNQLSIPNPLLNLSSSNDPQLLQQLILGGVLCSKGCYAAAVKCCCCCLLLVVQQLPQLLEFRCEPAARTAAAEVLPKDTGVNMPV